MNKYIIGFALVIHLTAIPFFLPAESRTYLNFEDSHSAQLNTSASTNVEGECHVMGPPITCDGRECEGECQIFEVSYPEGIGFECVCVCTAAKPDGSRDSEHVLLFPYDGSKPRLICAPLCRYSWR